MGPPSEMSQKSKNEYVEKMRMRYQSRGREGKSRLLDELVEVCGLTRKHAIKVMNRPVGSSVGRIETRGPKSTYGAAEREVVKAIWLARPIRPAASFLRPGSRSGCRTTSGSTAGWATRCAAASKPSALAASTGCRHR